MNHKDRNDLRNAYSATFNLAQRLRRFARYHSSKGNKEAHDALNEASKLVTLAFEKLQPIHQKGLDANENSKEA